MFKTKQNRFSYLPSTLINDLKSLPLTKAQLHNSIRFIEVIRNKSFRKYGNHISSVDIPFTYITKAFNNHYREWLSVLIENNIITVDNHYSTYKGICKSYSINNYYYNNTTSGIISYLSPVFIKDEEYQLIRDMVSEDLKQLNIDSDKLFKVINERVNSLSISEFKTNEDIRENSFELIAYSEKGMYKYFMAKDKAIIRARETNKSIIQDKMNFYLMNEDEFITMKKKAIKIAYDESVLKLSKEFWLASRNDRNRRLDTNITNLCSNLTDIICKDNDLIQIDLSNSQFSILSHILGQIDELKDKADFKRFKELCISGELYTYIQEELSLETRKKAKTAMFELLFSHQNNRTTAKAKLKLLFPNVVTWIDDYKKENGYEEFAVMLQKFESEMFIDNIWKNIKEEGFFCLTKHDSLIVKTGDVSRILEIANEHFNRINFTGKLVCSIDPIKSDLTKVEPITVSTIIEDEKVSEIEANDVKTEIKEVLFFDLILACQKYSNSDDLMVKVHNFEITTMEEITLEGIL
jgi:hypothetical protein